MFSVNFYRNIFRINYLTTEFFCLFRFRFFWFFSAVASSSSGFFDLSTYFSYGIKTQYSGTDKTFWNNVRKTYSGINSDDHFS
jgi:hypothetical protein